jgi:hypothetical protein
LQAQDKPQYKIYVDMDGVLADFVKGVDKLIPGGYVPEKKDDPKFKNEMWRAIKNYSKDGGTLWSELPLMPDAKQLWNYVEKHNPEILTASGPPEYGAADQKRRWIPWVLGADAKVNTVERSRDKAQFATPESILIDDQRKSIDPWVAAGGIGILHTSAANTIKELKKLGL